MGMVPGSHEARQTLPTTAQQRTAAKQDYDSKSWYKYNLRVSSFTHFVIHILDEPEVCPKPSFSILLDLLAEFYSPISHHRLVGFEFPQLVGGRSSPPGVSSTYQFTKYSMLIFN